MQLDSEVHLPCKSGQNNGTQPQAPGSHSQTFGVVSRWTWRFWSTTAACWPPPPTVPTPATPFPCPSGLRTAALERFDRLAENALFLLGHNIIDHDIPHLRALNPHLQLLKLPVVDTLRLNPLAYPQRPYHHLVKHYKDAGLVRSQVNDPLLDSKLAVEAFANQLSKLRESPPELLAAWHWLTTTEDGAGFDLVFSTMRGNARPTLEEAKKAIQRRLSGQGCRVWVRSVIDDTRQQGWPLAYVLAWLSVAGTNSVMPPWVLFNFPQAAKIIKKLRRHTVRAARLPVVPGAPRSHPGADSVGRLR